MPVASGGGGLGRGGRLRPRGDAHARAEPGRSGALPQARRAERRRPHPRGLPLDDGPHLVRRGGADGPAAAAVGRHDVGDAPGRVRGLRPADGRAAGRDGHPGRVRRRVGAAARRRRGDLARRPPRVGRREGRARLDPHGPDVGLGHRRQRRVPAPVRPGVVRDAARRLRADPHPRARALAASGDAALAHRCRRAGEPGAGVPARSGGDGGRATTCAPSPSPAATGRRGRWWTASGSAS